MKVTVSLIILFLSLSIFSGAQTITSYINKRGEQCSKSKALYVRKVTMEATVYHVMDYYLSGKLYMDARCTSVIPLLFEGPCVYYYENGQKQMEGNFTDNRSSGSWKYWTDKGELLSLNTVYKIFPVDSTIYDTSSPQTFEGLTDAEFPGGKEAFRNFITSTIQYPQDDAWRAISGVLIVLFVVDTTGKVIDINAVTRLGAEFEEEARRVCSAMPLWYPAVLRGEKVKVRKLIAINFILPPATSRGYR